MVKIYPLSHIDGYTFKPIRKIYSTKYTDVGDDFVKPTFQNPRYHSYALSEHGEINLTKQCDLSLRQQAEKYGGNAVLGVNYSITINSGVFGDGAVDGFGGITNSRHPVATMYAYGEAGKLVKQTK